MFSALVCSAALFGLAMLPPEHKFKIRMWHTGNFCQLLVCWILDEKGWKGLVNRVNQLRNPKSVLHIARKFINSMIQIGFQYSGRSNCYVFFVMITES